MKQVFITFMALAFLLSCGEESETESTPETNQQEEMISLDGMSEQELVEYASELEKKLVDQESLELSKEYSIRLLEVAQKHVEKYPKSAERREMIRKGSRAAQGLNQDYEAVRLLDLSINENSTDSTIVEEMNVRAYLFDKMDNKTRAEKAYKEIIEKFPNHPSSAMHKERLKTLHLTEEELIELFEKNNAK